MNNLFTLDKSIKNRDKYQRDFGYLFSLFFFIVAIYPMFFDLPVRKWSIALSIVFMLGALFFRKILIIPSIMWFKLGTLLHKLISPIILFIVYFLSIVLIGFIMKIFKKDPLQKKYDTKIKSYWIKKEKRKLNLHDQY
mgnify:FL=1